MLTTPISDRGRPVYGWFAYKEAFSSELVGRLLRHTQVPSGAVVVDPFGGTGTVALACREQGLMATSIDQSPLASFVTRAKLGAIECDWGEGMIALTEELIHALDLRAALRAPVDVSIWQKGFDSEVAGWLLSAVEFLEDFRARGEQPEVVDLVHLALLCIAEEVSHTVKDGTSLRLRPPGRRLGRAGVVKTPQDVVLRLRAQVGRMAADLKITHAAPRRSPCPATVVTGDARELGVLLRPASVDMVLTSPPYPNRYDYSSIYTLELLLGFVKNRKELRDLRFKLLRSHLEAPWPERLHSPRPAVLEILASMLHKGMNSNRNFKMLLGYFEDMRRTLEGIAEILKPGGRACLVVGNVRLEGEVVPVDLLVADIAQEVGLETSEILITRYKGTNSQQALRFGSARMRESIVCLQRAAVTR